MASQDALDFLLSRVSVSRVGGELPSTDALQKIFTAALRAPDHAGLKPWRYLKVAGEQREKLGELFVSAKLQDDPQLDQAAIDKLKKKPLRAPLVIVVIASIQDHPKVPEIEQMLSAGASTQNMLLARTYAGYRCDVAYRVHDLSFPGAGRVGCCSKRKNYWFYLPRVQLKARRD